MSTAVRRRALWLPALRRTHVPAMASVCDLHPTVSGAKGAVYVAVDGGLHRLTRNMILRGVLPDGRPIPSGAPAAVGVSGHVRFDDVVGYGSKLQRLRADELLTGLGSSVPPASGAEVSTGRILAQVSANAAAVADMGGWPASIGLDSITSRVPTASDPVAAGFDAGVAVALGMMPDGRAELAARLHAAYTAGSVAQVRDEMGLSDGRPPSGPSSGSGFAPDPDSPSVWWLSACSVCVPKVDAEGFLRQLDEFDRLRADPDARVEAAERMLGAMLGSFEVVDGLPFSVRDGGMQGAYLAGFEVAFHRSEADGAYYVGTFREEGLDFSGFSWDPPSAAGPVSGPMFGSDQFFRLSGRAELDRAVSFLRRSGQL